jgi:RND family efflux transporter MFP subunit
MKQPTTTAQPKKKRIIQLSVIAVVLVLGYFVVFGGAKSNPGVALTAPVSKGIFTISVQTTGEIKAKNQKNIDAPGAEMQQAGMWNGTKIQELVPEGTIVKEGDFVASLDKTPIMTMLQEAMLEVDKKSSEFKQARLDTAITLRDSRDELLNLKSAQEEARLEVQQSIYEAPAFQQQKQLALEKAERNYKQKVENYQTKVAQAATKVEIIYADLSKAQNGLDRINSLLQKMDITAPKDGMVIYVKNWNGSKKITGSNISPWEPAVATLPDLREIQVLTYVNEVDIRKIKPGQAADISLDAEPGKKLKGVVVQVANIGEQRPNQDSKVFEVVIDVLNPDSTLRPSMTTSNTIHIEQYKEAMSIPLEALTTDKSISYVWKKKGGKFEKKEVLVAALNDQSALIYAGLESGDEVYLSTPSDTSGIDLEKIAQKPAPPKPWVDPTEQKKLLDHLAKVQPTKRNNEDPEGPIVIAE